MSPLISGPDNGVVLASNGCVPLHLLHIFTKRIQEWLVLYWQRFSRCLPSRKCGTFRLNHPRKVDIGR